MYNLPLPVLICYTLEPYALRLLTATVKSTVTLRIIHLALYCAVLYILLV